MNMKSEIKEMKTLIETAIKEWIEQGRTEEQIFGVRNFMSGRGLNMVKEIKLEGYEQGRIKCLEQGGCVEAI